jgi:hypothetical protein
MADDFGRAGGSQGRSEKKCTGAIGHGFGIRPGFGRKAMAVPAAVPITARNIRLFRVTLIAWILTKDNGI